MEAYRREIGKQFGKRVPGVFTDEPNIRPAGGLPWSEILAAGVPEALGLQPARPPAQPDAAQSATGARSGTTTSRSSTSSSSSTGPSPTTTTARRNHLELTGHYWDHEWPNCAGVPDNMAMYAWHQRPGDRLPDEPVRREHPRPVRQRPHAQGAVQRRQPARPEPHALRGLRRRRLGPALRGHEAHRRLAGSAGRQHPRPASLLRHASAAPASATIRSPSPTTSRGGTPITSRPSTSRGSRWPSPRASRSTACSCSNRPPPPGCIRATGRS